MFMFYFCKDFSCPVFSVMAETSTACLLAGSALGKRGIFLSCAINLWFVSVLSCIVYCYLGVSPEEVGQMAGKELLLALSTGGCVDEYLQDQVNNYVNLHM